MPSAAPCPPVAALPQKQVVKAPAVAGPEYVEDKAEAVSGLENAKVAAEMNKLLLELQTERSYVGTSAFLIVALRYSVRVCVWYGTRSEDLLSVFAPRASDAISNKTLCEAVCCALRGDGSLGLPEDARRTNHRVASFPIGSGSLPPIDHGQSLCEGEPEATHTF